MSYRKIIGLFIVFSFYFTAESYAQHSVYVRSSREAFDDGYELFLSRKYNACIHAFEEYLVKYPENKEVLAKYYIAVSHLYLFHPAAEYKLDLLARQNQEHFVSSLARFELGRHFYGEGKYEKVIYYFNEVDKDQLSKEERGEYNFKLAYSYFSRREFEKALDLFERARLRPNQFQSASAYYAGYIFLELGKWEKALNVLKTLEKDPGYALHVPAMIAKAMYNAGHQDELIEYGNGIIDGGKQVKNIEQVSLFVGAAYFDKKDYIHAVEYLGVYKRKSEKPHRDVYYRLGYANYRLQQYYDAIDNLKNAMIPDDSLAQVTAYYLGHSYLKTNQKKYATTAFKQAFDLDFNKQIEEEALFNYGKLSYQDGNNGNTIIGLTRLLDKYPYTKYGNLTKEILSDAYLKSDNYEDAIKYLGGIRDKTDKVMYAYQHAAFMMAVKMYNCNDFDQTEKYLDMAFTYPVDSEIKASSYFLKAEMRSRQENYNEAILNYSGVFQTDQARSSQYYLKSRYGIAFAYYNHKEFSKAKDHYLYYINNTPQKDNYYYDAMIRLADCYYSAKTYAEAEKWYEKVASETTYMNDYALFHIGVMAFINKEPEKSKKNFRELAEKHPKSGFADNALFQAAIVDLDVANYELAIKDFNTLCKNFPGSDLIPFALEKRGIAYSNIGNYKEAKKDFVQIIETYPTHEVAKGAIYSLQETLNKLGETDNLKKYLDLYKSANPEDQEVESVEYENAKGLHALGKYEKGIVELKEFLKNYPKSEKRFDARYFLAECQQYSGKTKEALENYEMVISDDRSYLATKAIYKCADLYYSVDSFAFAKEKYKILVVSSLKNKYQIKGYKGQIKCAWAMADYPETIKLSNDLIKEPSARSRDIDEAYLYRAKAQFESGNDSAAVNSLKKVMKSSTYEEGAEANYLIAKYQYDNQQYAKSIETLHELNKHFASYDYWLGKSFLLIADNYISSNEMYQAKATLISLKEKSTIKEIVEEAELKLQFMNQDGMEADSVKIMVEPDTLKNQNDGN